MKLNEKGFTLLELVIASAIMVLVSGAAGIAIFQIFRNTERNSNYMTTVNQVQNAGYWISRDAQMALGITTDNLTPSVLLEMRWIEDSSSENPIYHSANYTIENLTNNIGTLMRAHSSSDGTNEQTLIAQYIYYNPADSANTTQASYQNPLLTVQLTAIFEESLETREYRIKRRPNTF
ncbi:type II secretion system protein J [Chloroflexota bacterium]